MFDEAQKLYQDIVLDRGRHPRHQRVLDPFDAAAHADNPLCGDRIDLRLRHDQAGQVAELAFDARGCAISIASADLMADAVRGLTHDEVENLASAFEDLVRTGDTASDDASLASLRPLAGVADYPSRVKCAILPWSALRAALASGQGET